MNALKNTIEQYWTRRASSYTEVVRKNLADGWDGKYKGKDVAQGVYFVLVEAKGADGKTYKIKRDVNLLRGFTESTTNGGTTE